MLGSGVLTRIAHAVSDLAAPPLLARTRCDSPEPHEKLGVVCQDPDLLIVQLKVELNKWMLAGVNSRAETLSCASFDGTGKEGAVRRRKAADAQTIDKPFTSL
jgi:hypothetical protein